MHTFALQDPFLRLKPASQELIIQAPKADPEELHVRFPEPLFNVHAMLEFGVQTSETQVLLKRLKPAWHAFKTQLPKPAPSCEQVFIPVPKASVQLVVESCRQAVVVVKAVEANVKELEGI